MGQICPLVFTHLRTLSPGLEKNGTLECISDSFPGTLTYLLFLENCWNFAPMCGFSPIQWTKSWLVLKLHVTRIWECDILYYKYRTIWHSLHTVSHSLTHIITNGMRWRPNIIIYSHSNILNVIKSCLLSSPLPSSCLKVFRNMGYVVYWDSFGCHNFTLSDFIALKLPQSHTLTFSLDPNLLCMGSP